MDVKQPGGFGEGADDQDGAKGKGEYHRIAVTQVQPDAEQGVKEIVEKILA